MITRHYIVCITCGQLHILRISVGHDALQKHSFRCRSCSEPIALALRVDYENIRTELKTIDNCDIVARDDDGPIVNLSPQFVLPEHLHGMDTIFPSMMEHHRLREANPDYFEQQKLSVADTSLMSPHPPGVTHDWEFARRVWSLFLNRRHDECSDYISRNHSQYRFSERPQPLEVIYTYCAKVGLSTANRLFYDFAHEFKVAKNNSPEALFRFVKYFVDQHFHNLLVDSYDIIREYMQNYSEFSQVLFYVETDVEIPSDSRPTSVAFDDTKMFYGNAFECLGKYLMLPACLHNLTQGRSHDVFETMTLSEYMKISKANKAKPFRNNARLGWIGTVMDNRLRNASHHANVRYNEESGDIIYRPTQSPTDEHISYGQYLVQCNRILQCIAAFMCVSLAIFDLAELAP